MRVNVYDESFEYVKLFGKPALFTESHIDRDTVPQRAGPKIRLPPPERTIGRSRRAVFPQRVL